MYQPQDAYDRTWLDIPLVSVDIKTDNDGLASEIFMITAVPSEHVNENETPLCVN
jgi:hypothetical protein